MGGTMNGWMNQWMNGWVNDGRMNGWNGCFYLLCCMYTISYHVVHINLNVKSVKREEEVK